MKEPTTSCTKNIWIVVFKDKDSGHKTRTQRVAAWSFLEVCSFFNTEGLSTIIEVRKLDEEVTYHY